MAHKKPVTMVTFTEGNEWLYDKDERGFFFFFFYFFYSVPLGIFEFSIDVHILF